MSLQAVFFIADTHTAESIDDPAVIDASNQFDSYNLTELEVSYLYQVLLGVEPEYDGSLGFKMVHMVNAGESFTTSLPAEFVALLAEIPPDKFSAVSKAWANTELGWPQADAEEVLEQLNDLAKKAQQQALPMYLFNSL